VREWVGGAMLSDVKDDSMSPSGNIDTDTHRHIHIDTDTHRHIQGHT